MNEIYKIEILIDIILAWDKLESYGHMNALIIPPEAFWYYVRLYEYNI